MTAAFDTWLDRVAAGEKPTAANFARSAIEAEGRIEPIRTRVRPLNYRAWGYSSQAEMDAAMGEGGE